MASSQGVSLVMALAFLTIFCVAQTHAAVIQPSKILSKVSAYDDKYFCAFCEDAVENLLTSLGTNATDAKIVEALDKICDQLPQKYQAICKAAVVEIAQQIQTGDYYLVFKYSPLAFCGFIQLCQIDCCLTSYNPEQIHISSTNNPSEMIIVWTTLRPTNQQRVMYGLTEDSLTTEVFANTSSYTSGGWRGFIHSATLTGLNPSTTYYYKVGDPSMPDIFIKPFVTAVSLKFTTRALSSATSTVSLAVIGDAGATDVSMYTYVRLTDLVLSNKINFTLHVGDIGYSDGYEPIMDAFLRKVEPVASLAPYMTVQGNHEGFYNFAPYKARFPVPYVQSGSPSPLFYSFNYGNIHFVAINTESFMGLNVENITSESPQYKWLENDLIAANRNRQQVPWIVVLGHRAIYCSGDSKNCKDNAKILQDGIEQLLNDQKVNLVLAGHKHNYQTTFPVFKNNVNGTFQQPGAPVYILSGAAGNKEHLNGFGSSEPWFRNGIEDYGYGILSTANSSTIHWQFFSSFNNTVLDEIYVNNWAL